MPVPVRLRDAKDGADLNFERLARERFAQEAPKGVPARTKTDRVWQQLLADDRPVVLADGLEEALLDDGRQQNRVRHGTPPAFGRGRPHAALPDHPSASGTRAILRLAMLPHHRLNSVRGAPITGRRALIRREGSDTP
ncbi:hypothetical protein ACIBAH_09175 [Streptomyces sp. NPDC051445]|uniref:hypothetical protein n=1 Tax=Streptomyces sp. NPDC051445 TaxID=3365653 RepID=UPI003787FCBB